MVFLDFVGTKVVYKHDCQRQERSIKIVHKCRVCIAKTAISKVFLLAFSKFPLEISDPGNTPVHLKHSYIFDLRSPKDFFSNPPYMSVE